MLHFQPMFARCVKKGQAGSLQVLIEEIGWEVRLWLADSFREEKGICTYRMVNPRKENSSPSS